LFVIEHTPESHFSPSQRFEQTFFSHAIHFHAMITSTGLSLYTSGPLSSDTAVGSI